MARKKNGASTPQSPIEEADDVVRHLESAEMAAATLTGDLRDFILDRLRHEQSKQPWHKRSEADQRDTVHQVEAAVRHAVSQAVEIIAGHGRRAIRAHVESVTIKEGYKAVLTMSRADENRHKLADATGYAVLVVIADPEEFTGERAPVDIVPDQSTLLGDVEVVHSEPDGQHVSPFH